MRPQARPALSRALADGVADPRLQGNYDPVEMARLVASAAASVRHSAKKRPKMSQVLAVAQTQSPFSDYRNEATATNSVQIVRALEGDMSLEDLNEGVRPGQSMAFGTAAAGYKPRAPSPYTSDMERIRKMPMAISEYSGSIGSEESFDDNMSPVRR
jgi:hypothetical protein